MLSALIRGATRPAIHEAVARHLDAVTGLRNIPRSGPVVVVANHTSYADHFFIMTALHAVRPGEVWYPTKAEAFEKPLSKLWHESMRCFAVDRDAPGTDVFRQAEAVLDAGHVLVVYPEGTRGRGDELLPFKSGAFRMALKSDAPVVPMGLAHANRVLPKGSRRITGAVAGIAVGEPLSRPRGQGREVVHAMRDEARRRIEELVERAGNPSPHERLDSVLEIARLMDEIIVENLDREGRLSADANERLMLLHRLGRALEKRNDASLELQRLRLQGLKALGSTTPVHRVMRAAVVNRHANRLAEQESENAFASYLAASTNVVTPSFLGGDRERARRLFEKATTDRGMASKAYVGLGHVLLNQGKAEQAAQAWARARNAIDAKDPRGEARRQRVDALLDQYAEAS